MSDAKQIIDETLEHLVKTYALQPVVMDHGDGVYTWDTDGKKYLDFAAGIAVASLGHNHPALVKTITEQAPRLMALQPSYTTREKHKATKLLSDTTGFDLIYFSNSGTESVEACLKCARKWAYDEKGEQANEIIAFRNSFHGRTYGSASVTEKFHSQPFFNPYVGGIQWANFNDIESVRAVADASKTAAIIVEPVQGEGGLTPADPAFLQGLRELCDALNICLIFDEVQTGFGRLGTYNAYDAFGVKPDLAAWAKGMGAGFPVGGMGGREKFASAITAGTHGTTYGGNPLACAVVGCVVEEMQKPEFMANIRAVSKVLFDGLEDIKRKSNKIEEIKGLGLMIGVKTIFKTPDVLKHLQKNGMMATLAGGDVLRLTPPLVLNEDEAREGLAILEKTLQEME
ncbi:MAG: aspartate aminotransferase family protein [Alphaproteobacteria bacterium]